MSAKVVSIERARQSIIAGERAEKSVRLWSAKIIPHPTSKKFYKFLVTVPQTAMLTLIFCADKTEGITDVQIGMDGLTESEISVYFRSENPIINSRVEAHPERCTMVLVLMTEEQGSAAVIPACIAKWHQGTLEILRKECEVCSPEE